METRVLESLDSSHTAIIDRANPAFYFFAVTVVFFTLLSPSWSIIILWSAGLSVLGAYLFFRNCYLVPNLLIHLKPVNYQEQVDDGADVSPSDNTSKTGNCNICGNSTCNRHSSSPESGDILPWEGFEVPKSTDDTLSKFLNIILKRFIHSWHDDLTTDESFIRDMKLILRYAICIVLQRAGQIDIPKVVTGPLLRVIAEHIDVYLNVKRRMPPTATQEDIRDEVLRVLGRNRHIGLRGQLGNLKYFKSLTRNALPLLMPPGLSESRVLNLFMEDLFALKIMIPAMNFVATPDFLNKILILIFDKDSKLVRMIGPQSRLVPFLEEFAIHTSRRHAIQTPINHMIKSQRLLYPFMVYLKKNGGIHLLQFYLSCNELRTSIAKLDIDLLHERAAFTNIDQITRIFNLYMSATATNRIYFNPLIVSRIEKVLLSDYPNELKLLQLMEYKLLDLACNSVLVYLENFFCPNFFHSQQYHDAMMPISTGQPSGRSISYTDSTSSLSSYFERWRKRRKKVYLTPQQHEMAQSSPNIYRQVQQDQISSIPTIARPRSDSASSSLSSSSTCDSLEETVVVSIPSYVQVVDWQIITTGIKPHTIYCIVSKFDDGAEDKLVYRVQRRYKEFHVLDTRIHQFYNDVNVHLPPKKTIKNMDKTFIESRAKELEKYLKVLITEPEVQGSQLLRSFLTDTADVSLFMPNTMGDKAGKIIKSVPHILKKETKGQHLENLLQIMESSVSTPSRHCSSKKKAQFEEQSRRNEAIVKEYEKAVIEDESAAGVALLNSHNTNGNGVFLNGALDMIVYLAINVYGVSQTQLASLLVVKLLGQNSIEAYIHHLLAGRIEIILMENKSCELIELLQNSLFFNDSPPRTEADKEARLAEATRTVLTRLPSVLIKMIGKDKFEANTKLLIEGLQDPVLNKQMLFSMLDVVLWELFPEL